MSAFKRNSTLAGLLFAAQFLSGAASAHIHLLDPQPRYPDEVSGENKNCPCGVGTGGRSCTKPEERSDVNRSADRANALVGGSMMTVELDEYVGHSGRYRIAFDPDGADLDDFNAHILADIPDPSGNRGNSGNGSIWDIAAPLPNIDCDNCTLQVIQMMNGDMLDPVEDPVGKSTYYQCADLVLTKDTSKPEGYAVPLIVLGDAMGMATGSTPDMTTGMTGGTMPGGTTTGGTMPGMTPATSTASGNMTGTTGVEMASDDSGGGCSLSPLQNHGVAQPLGVAAAALLLGSRRRRRSRASAASVPRR